MKNNKVNNFISKILTLTLGLTLFYNTYSFAVSDPVTEILTEVLQILLGLAGAICVGKLVHIGILYMTSSAAEKSNAKAAVLPWIIGTIVCFGAGWIGPMIINIFRIDDGGNVLGIN